MQPCTIKKAWLDGKNLYNHARAVIILDKNGNIQEIIDRRKGYLVNVLAILGPVAVNGEVIEYSVRGEIGFGRTAPYTTTETEIDGAKEKIRVTKRRVFLPLNEREEIFLLSHIQRIIQKVVDESVLHRKSITYWKSRHSDSLIYRNGKFITVPSNMLILRFACLAKDMQIKKNGHLNEFASRTRLKLSRLKFWFYPTKRFRKLKSVNEIAYILGEAEYGEYVLEIIRKKIGKEGSKERVLFEQILEEFNLSPMVGKDIEYVNLLSKLGHLEKNLLETFYLEVNTHQKRIKKKSNYFQDELANRTKKGPAYQHATGCLRVEVNASEVAVDLHSKGHSSIDINYIH